MKKIWVFLWYKHLQLNSDYKRYCMAVRNENKGKIDSLENRYAKLRELYSDWGDLYADNEQWSGFESWFKKHRRLFYAKRSMPVSIANNIDSGNSSTILSIPHSLDKDAAIEQVTELLEKLTKNGKHLSPNSKYMLYKTKSLDSTQVVGLYKGLTVALLMGQKQAGSKMITSNTEIVKEIMLSGDKYWGWEFSEDDLQRMKSGKMKSLELQDYRRQVTRYSKYADTVIANTIHGVFPRKDKVL